MAELLAPTVGLGKGKGHRKVVQDLIISWLKGLRTDPELLDALEKEHTSGSIKPDGDGGYLFLGYDYEQQVWIEVK